MDLTASEQVIVKVPARVYSQEESVSVIVDAWSPEVSINVPVENVPGDVMRSLEKGEHGIVVEATVDLGALSPEDVVKGLGKKLDVPFDDELGF